ncbi:OmpA family protein [Niabella ginsengisoli]|uniref:OmpA family protein n=1 Tax=Niabella ginsengisoli TaxID=522298 RepID=A0ABS9SDX7_9BACT|nr:OmpA family protein [Niabella ginsengisoli]MCH5596561.1 OmpA family protein [Niabella ginsengisoli]
MTSKKYQLLAGLSCLVASTGFAQVSPSHPYTAPHPVYGTVSVTDSNYYNSKQLAQHNEFMVGNYDYPAKPKDMWELGVKVGSLTINGDASADFNPLRSFGFGGHLRKSLGHVLSLRLEYLYGKSEGQAWQGPAEMVDGVTRVANYRTTSQDLSLQLLANVGNIRFYKGQTGATIYVLGGFGVGTWSARYVNGLTSAETERKDILKDLREQYKDIEKADMIKHVGDNPRWSKTFAGYISPSATVGAGIAFRLSSRVNLALEDRFIFNGSDVNDASFPALHANQDKDFYNYATIGLNFNLGSKSKRVEPLYWLNPLNYAYGELRRVPEIILPDADGDGVTDQFDQEQTPAGCPVDTHGVSRDTDGDGVPDCKDKELVTPTYCQPVDADGVGKCPCPEDCKGTIGTECAALLGALPSIHFEANSNKLSDDAAGTLATVASKLKANPNCKVVVVGYCAATKRQQQLSWDHVNKVISHLVENEGVGSDRFIFSSGQEGGDCDVVDIRAAAMGEDGPNTVAPPHPNLRKN